MQSLPARPGDSIDDVDTPTLVVDLDAFERNLDLMANAVRGAGVALRPHAKSHKCPDIAHAQIGRGAVGICCQKVGEAEAFVAAGIRDVLVTNEIVGERKLARLAAMAKRAKVGVLADDAATVRHIGAAARAAGVSIDVLVEIDVGAHRCGTAPGAPAVAIAQVIARTPGISFRGIHAYHGAAQHLRAPDERRAAIARAAELAAETKATIEAAGIACATVTGAGTGTWQHERDSGVYTEIQPGSYVFMDADYQKNALAPDQHHFEQSLFVLAGVMSAPVRERASRRCRAEGVRVRLGPSGRLRRRRADVRERLRRARRAGGGARRPATAHRRPALADPRTLRPDGQSLRLDRRRARHAGGVRLAGRRARRVGLIGEPNPASKAV